MSDYKSGIGYAAGNMMLKWNTLTEKISQSNLKLGDGDDVNIFISFESIMSNMIKYKNLNHQINNHKQMFVIELESAILNLVAHYKSFCSRMNYKAKIFLYYTDINVIEHKMRSYNKFYREYYMNIYMQNPMYNKLGKLLSETIINEIKLIMTYVSDCYFIETKTFDSILSSKIILDNNGGSGIIITSDILDTALAFDPRFLVIYNERTYKHQFTLSTIDDFIAILCPVDPGIDMSIFKTELYYNMLLVLHGSDIRNIKPCSKLYTDDFIDSVKKLIEDPVLRNASSIESLSGILKSKNMNHIKMGYDSINIDIQYMMLHDSDVSYVMNQIIDKIDTSSLEILNNQRFIDFPINLQSLL